MKEYIYTESLQPCPFCGCNRFDNKGQAVKIVKVYRPRPKIYGEYQSNLFAYYDYFVQCGFCGAQGGAAFAMFTDATETELQTPELDAIRRASEKWNNRDTGRYAAAIAMAQTLREKEAAQQ